MMAAVKLCLIYGLVFLIGNFFIKETNEETITTNQSETAAPHLERAQVNHDVEGVRTLPLNAVLPGFSPRESKCGGIYTTPQPLAPKNMVDIKHEERKNNGKLLTTIKTYVNCHSRRILDIIKDLWKRQIGSLSMFKNSDTVVDQELNSNKKDFVKNARKINNSAIQEGWNKTTNELPLVSRDINFNRDFNDIKLPDHGSNSTVVEVYTQDREGTVKRIKRCVGRVCEDHQKEKTDIPNNLKQPDLGSNSNVAEISVAGLQETTLTAELNREQKCVGKDCKETPKDDCNGLSPEICNDISEVAAMKEKEKLNKEDQVLTFDAKEFVGLAMLFLLGCFMMYLYIRHGRDDEVRKYMSIGTLALFLLCITVLSQIVARSQDYALKKKV